MRSRTNIYLDGLLGGVAFSILLSLGVVWWEWQTENLVFLGFYTPALVGFGWFLGRRIALHLREDDQASSSPPSSREKTR